LSTTSVIPQVFKFGGAALCNPDAIKNVVRIISEHPTKALVVVVSAMGKMTNQLEKLIEAHLSENVKSRDIELETFFKYHDDIVNHLFELQSHPIFQDIHNLKTTMRWCLDEHLSSSDAVYDQLIVFGELFSSTIVFHALCLNRVNAYFVDIRNIFKTDDHYRDAAVDIEYSEARTQDIIQPLLTDFTVVTQGFIGSTSDNYSTSLGREGSDYSAALLANFLNAHQLTVWKDVPGVLNADPRYFQNARLIEHLNYQDAVELTYYGATVLHPKTIKPLQNKAIPLYVRSFLDLKHSGTCISNYDYNTYKPKSSYILKKNLVLITAQRIDLSFITEAHISKIYHLLWMKRAKIHVMQISAVSFSFCCDRFMAMDQFIEELSHAYSVKYNTPVQLLTIRNYQESKSAQVLEGKTILLEQRSRQTCQFVLPDDV
jgi:aspartate kinase